MDPISSFFGQANVESPRALGAATTYDTMPSHAPIVEPALLGIVLGGIFGASTSLFLNTRMLPAVAVGAFSGVVVGVAAASVGAAAERKAAAAKASGA